MIKSIIRTIICVIDILLLVYAFWAMTDDYHQFVRMNFTTFFIALMILPAGFLPYFISFELGKEKSENFPYGFTIIFWIIALVTANYIISTSWVVESEFLAIEYKLPIFGIYLILFLNLFLGHYLLSPINYLVNKKSKN